MAGVIKKSLVRAIASSGPRGYNKQWKPERQKGPGLPGKYRWMVGVMIGICAAALLLAVFQQVSARSISQPMAASQVSGRVPPANVYSEPIRVQGDQLTNDPAQTGIWFGLAASLSGALVLGLSFLMLQRQAT